MSTDTHDTQTLVDRLFAVGAHFGFSKSRRHPTVKPYLYGNKQGTDIFDLEKTASLIGAAKEAMTTVGKEGKTALFVATKEEVGTLTRDAAERAEMPYMVNRWIGGTLTNFPQIKKRVDRLTTLMSEGESGELERKYTKKERVVIGRELERLQFKFGGITGMEKTPDMLVVVDPRHDSIAVSEANDLNIPIVGIMSSDNDMSKVTYPVVVNDALQSSVSLVLNELIDAYQEGKKEYTPKPAREQTRRRSR